MRNEEQPALPHEERTSSPGTYGRVAALGFVTGLRSQTAIAALAFATGPEQPYTALAGDAAPWRWLGTSAARIGFGLTAAGEYVGDKLPQTPGRLTPGPLGGRIAFGALTGAAVCRAEGRSPVLGGALGALCAFGGSYAGYQYRTAVAQRKAPDLPFAIIEDAVAIILALAAVRSAAPDPEPEYVI